LKGEDNMPSIRNIYHRQDRDSGVNEREMTHANVRSELPTHPGYYEARNFRPYSFEKLSKDGMNNLKGTVEKIDLTGSFIYWNDSTSVLTLNSGGLYSDHVIIGVGKIRDRTIIISTNNTGAIDGGGETAIWSAFLNHPTLNSQLSLVRHWIGSLGYSTQYPVFKNIVGRYESENIQKIYFTDGQHNLHYCNVAMSYASTLFDQAITEFEIMHLVDFSKPILSNIFSGNIPTGVVQYAYRYYKINGPESVFSPSSDLIPLTDKSETSTDTSKYKGQSQLDDGGNANKANKAVEMSVSDLDTSYDRIEIIAIHYTTLTGDPTINIVSRLNISGTSLLFTDSGNYNQGTYSLNEFRTLGGLLFSCKTLSAKDNRLFPGNLKLQNFDVDFDARAYRFLPTGGILSRLCVLQSSPGVAEYTINGANPAVTTGSYISWNSIPETAACLNAYNIITNDGNLFVQMKYQTDGVTFGGEGPNVKYTFDMEKMNLDDHSSDITMKVGLEGSASNPSYYSYASPFIKTVKLSFRNDETYRIGIVFENTRGQESFPKWMGDVRFPRGDESSNYYQFAKMETYAPYARLIKLRVSLKSIPTGTVGWKVVRVVRTEKDKSIVCGGMLGAWRTAGGEPYQAFYDVADNIGVNIRGAMASGVHYFHLMSPEINFYKSLSVSTDDYIDPFAVARLTWNSTQFQRFGSYDYGRIVKLRDMLPIPAGYQVRISDGSIYEPVEDSMNNPNVADLTTYTIGSSQFKMLVNQYYNPSVGPPGYWISTGRGTCFVGEVASQLNLPGIAGNLDYVYANYKRKVVQYGGYDYTARSNNVYIPCSEIFDATLNTYRDIWGGDSYTSFYDYLYSQPVYAIGGETPSQGGSLRGYSSVMWFPVQTSINLNLRHDDCFHRIKDSFNSRFLREEGNNQFRGGTIFSIGSHSGSTAIFETDWTNLYLYNSVYSRENDSKIHITEPLDFIEEEENDVLVIASREKSNTEERDSWLRYDTAERIDLDSQYGPLEELITFNNHLLFFQHDGVGTLSVNERALLQDVTAAALELGTGKILDRYDMLATNTGVQAQGRVRQSPMGFYWVDVKRKEFQRYSGKLMNIAKIKGADSWMQDFDNSYITGPDFNSANIKGVMLGYDPSYKEILIFKKDSSITGEALVFNELKDEFTSIIDYGNATMFFNNNHQLMAFTANKEIHELNVGNYNQFFGEYKDPKIIYLINPLKEKVCVFNTFEFANEIYDASGNNLTDATPNTIRLSNDYQDTGYIVQSSGTNIKRRMRTWRFVDFRDSSNARMRDTYLKLELTFDGSLYGKIIMHSLTSHYMVPAESLHDVSDSLK
jgi:hypothetical protein